MVTFPSFEKIMTQKATFLISITKLKKTFNMYENKILLKGFTLVQTISNQTSREVGREEKVQYFRASQIKINQEEEI